MDELWALIQNTAESIKGYYKFLGCDYAQSDEGVPVSQVVEGIIKDNLDHLDALKYLHLQISKVKPTKETVEIAMKKMSDYRENKRQEG